MGYVRAVIINKEQPVIDVLSAQLMKCKCVQVLAAFPEISAARDWLAQNPVDLVFWDAKTAREEGAVDVGLSLFPKTDIVFTSAYENQPVLALSLELGALDGIKAFTNQGDNLEAQSSGIQLSVQCLGQLMLPDLEAPKWRTSKVKELLAFFVHHRGMYVPKDSIIEAVWPGLDRDKASNLFNTNLHYLRKMLEDLGYEDIIIHSNGTYKIQRQRLQVDVDRFLEVWEQIRTGRDISTDAIEAAADSYLEGYLALEGYEWASQTQVRLEDILIKILKKLIGILEDSAPERQERYLLQWISKEPYSPNAYSKLLQVYSAQGNVTAFVKTYKTMVARLRTELGIEPDSSVTKLYNDLYQRVLTNAGKGASS